MKKKYILYGVIGILMLAAAAYMEKTDSVLSEDGTILRESAEGDSKEVTLILNAEGLPENYRYDVTIEQEQLSEEEAEEYFCQAEEELEAGFFAEGDTSDRVCSDVTMMESCVDGLVTADWILSDYSCITAEGVLIPEEIPAEGMIVQADITLTCQKYKELYEFSFRICQPEADAATSLLEKIEDSIQKENARTGSRTFLLPSKVDGVILTWKTVKEHLLIKMLFLEIVLAVMLKIAELENERIRAANRRALMEAEYSEIVSKLSILMGAGMSLKQAWKAITVKYLDDRKQNLCAEMPAYEEMAVTLRMMQDGESETAAYAKFGERCQAVCFYRLSRMLIRNLEKGSRKICSLLRKESEEAFEERRLNARKKGEEAGTKMLAPLMLMLMVVIAIIIVPAIISFQF